MFLCFIVVQVIDFVLAKCYAVVFGGGEGGGRREEVVVALGRCWVVAAPSAKGVECGQVLPRHVMVCV